MSTQGSDETMRIRHGTKDFRRTNLALFAAGFCNFSLMYCVQPLMPTFSATFGVHPAEASLSLSLTTGVLAFAMLVCGALSDARGRKQVMKVSLLASSLLTLVTALMPSWHGLLLMRTLMGLSLSGVPAVAMAYVSEEMHVDSVGLAMGLFIGGSAVGGMGGRLLTGVFTDVFGWRAAIACIGVIGLAAALVFWRTLPESRHFQARRLRAGALARTLGELLRERGLRWLFIEGFLLMGTFVTLYNYIGYRLLAPPYSLSVSAEGAIFAVYLVGIFSSTWMGHVANRMGRRKCFWSAFVLLLAGMGLMLLQPLAAVVLGLAVVTFGFFAGHSMAASWVGRRAPHSKAQASSLYLFAYYMGSSLAGVAGGLFWSRDGWLGVTLFTAVLTVVGLFGALRLIAIPPLATSRNTPIHGGAAQ
ncbi:MULTISPECIES: MFS transporter [Oleiagrimonas]|nr:MULTISPECIES: MFS transporter [Oleiagrimonas]